MRQALRLAARAYGFTSPNPMVGAVIVKDGRVIGRGYHAAAGQPHAEVLALRGAGDSAPGATLYVTLEPCCHCGRTPPCTDAIIASGISRVVVAIEDPNPNVLGKGIETLRKAGVVVEVGCLAEEAARLNRAFFKSMLTGLPWVALKLAVSLDGRIPTGGPGQYLTGPEALRRVHKLRSRFDVVMVGSGTVLADDPRLTVRRVQGRDPLRVVLDTHGVLTPNCLLLGPEMASGTRIYVGETCSPDRRRSIEATGATVYSLPEREGHVDLRACLSHLTECGFLSVLLEGGPTLAASFLSEQLVDSVYLHYAPVLLGAGGVPAAPCLPIDGPPGGWPGNGIRVSRIQTRRFGQDLEYRGCVEYPGRVAVNHGAERGA